MTVHREQIVKRARKPTRCNNQMFIINTVSTCFGDHYAHLQENKGRVLLHVVYCASSAGCGLVAVVGRCVVGCEHCVLMVYCAGSAGCGW